MHEWLVKPGETFGDRGTLGWMRFRPRSRSRTPALLSELLELVQEVRTILNQEDTKGEAPFEQVPILAPEAGVLIWQSPPGPRSFFTPLVRYVPLKAWERYEKLLAEHDQLFKRRSDWMSLDMLAADAHDPFHFALNGLLLRCEAITARALQSDCANLIPRLVRRLRQTIEEECPLPPAALEPVFGIFCQMQSLDERLQTLNAYRQARLQPELSLRETKDNIGEWMSHQEAIFQQALQQLIQNLQALAEEEEEKK